MGFPKREWLYATDPQVTYIKRLQAEAFAHLWSDGWHCSDYSRLLKREASKRIGELLAAKAKGWKRNV